MKELIDLRKPREKHFLNPDGTFTVQMYDHDIHYLKNGKYEEIDNQIHESDAYYENRTNSFRIRFDKKRPVVTVFNHEKYLSIEMCDFSLGSVSVEKNKILYTDLSSNLQLQYSIFNGKVKESIILNNKENIKEELSFHLSTNLQLQKDDNGNILVLDNTDILFVLQKSFMIDNEDNVNASIDYDIQKVLDDYVLLLKLDDEWLKDAKISYPVIIDPTIMNGREENVYDVYISSYLDQNKPYGTYHITSVGPKENGVGRALLKFVLPELDPSCSIVKATAYLSTLKELGLLGKERRVINVHEITTTWDENTATWNNMNDKFDPLVRTYFYPTYSPDLSIPDEPVQSSFDLTKLVKEWYSGKENKGVLLKYNNETYNDNCVNYTFYNKEYDLEYSTLYRPYLEISYRIQNGIENYMDYRKINYSNGTSYINNYNGNIVNIFDINKTLGQKYPIGLSAVYNAAEATKNENHSQIGIGWRWNFSEMITTETIDTENYLRYVNDSGAIHYMISKSDNLYVDEDGLGLEVTLDQGKYIMLDQEKTKKEFTNYNGIYKLSKITNISSDSVAITYQNDKISKLVDADGKEMSLNYSNNSVTVTSEYDTVVLSILNNQLQSIQNKFGTTSFLYNDKKLITKITDTNGLYNTYEYQSEQSYKVLKICNYGKNDKAGTSLLYSYEADVTYVTDNLVKYSYLFDEQGRLVNQYMSNMLSTSTSLADSYGVSKNYLNYDSNINKNKASDMTVPIKFVENLLENSSFEEDISKCNFTVRNATIVSENANLGMKSLQLSNTNPAEIEYEIKYAREYTYTLSFDFKCLDSQDVTFELIGSDNAVKDMYVLKTSYNNQQYNRISLTGDFTHSNKVVLKITQSNASTNCFIDNIQLEIGPVANLYNLVNNSAFQSGLAFWEASGHKNDGSAINPCYEIVSTSGGNIYEKALHLFCDAEGSSSLSQNFMIPGKKGDLYHVSFWYKSDAVLDPDSTFGNLVNLQFTNTNPDMGSCTFNLPLYANINEWQFFSSTFVAENDYPYFRINFISGREPNGIYVTNVMINKDLSQVYLEYDESGNLIGLQDLSSNKNFSYDSNNQLISEFNALGHNFKYEYDNSKKNQLLKGISPTGISNEIKYDDDGKPIKTIINNVNVDGELIEGHYYNIRLKGTDTYLMYDYVTNELHSSNNRCNYTEFQLAKHGDYYRLYLNDMVLSAEMDRVYFTSVVTDNSLYRINKLDNGSYYFLLKGKSECLAYENGELTKKEVDLTTVDWNFVDSAQFYFEDLSTNLFIETNAKYDETGTYISEMIDQLGFVKKYQKNLVTGLTEKIIDANGTETNLTYNNHEQITSLTFNGKTITYTYNDNNMLSSIQIDGKNYQCTYDDFLNIKEILLNNQSLAFKEYNQDNKITKVTYGNDHTAEYEYDYFQRLQQYTKGTDIYHFEYNNLGYISKVFSDSEKYNYMYDYANRLSRFATDDYSMDYTYDNNGNILSKILYYNEKKYISNYEYDANDNLIKIDDNGNIFHLGYDYLGRIREKSLNSIKTVYSYITNGYKTSCTVREVKVGEDVYRYIYDNLYNITKIYINKELIYEYSYNSNNHLDTEINYKYNRKYKYFYNDKFNLIKIQESNLYDLLLKEDIFEYTNSSWEDQVTKYNNKAITYDELGNIKTYNGKTFEWANARELVKITGNDSIINYVYNVDGIRTKKIVNGITTDYVLDGNNVIIENRNGNVIYYIRDNIGDVIGLKYLNQLYYYKKNYQGDVIGIYNNNGEEIATYEYDAWGNILNVLDNAGIEITDNTHIALINPYRYRGYYYDVETNLYYLKSRYYSPELHRFISIDSSIYQNISSKNLYIYCGNNPVVRRDNEGDSFLGGLIWGFAGAAINVGAKMIDNVSRGKSVTDGIGEALIDGAVGGIAAYTSFGITIGVTIATNIVSNTINESISYVSGQKELNADNVNESALNIGKNTVVDSTLSLISGGIVKNLGFSTNGGWFKPQKFLPSLAGKHSRKYYLSTFLENFTSNLIAGLFAQEEMGEVIRIQVAEINLF